MSEAGQEADWGTDSVAARIEAEALIVDVEGYEGPLDLLLTLSRRQKVDLRRISVLGLAEQYLRFVEAARALGPLDERTVFGKSIFLFDGIDRPRLQQLGELRTPNVSDLFVATMKGTYA